MAATFTGLPDSWVPQVEGPISNGTPTSIDLAGSAGFQFPPGGFPAVRLALFDATKTAMQTRGQFSLVGNTLSWVDSLPAGFVPATARIELQEIRYSWLATVRTAADGSSRQIDIVVFFNRTFDPSDETVYGLPAVVPIGSTMITLPKANERTKPGSWLFDADNARWYRVLAVRPDGLTIDPAAIEPIQNVVFQRGIVDVFPIGAK